MDAVSDVVISTPTWTQALRARLAAVWAFFRADKRAMVGGFILLVVVFMATFGTFITPHDPAAVNLEVRFQGPSWEHWMGTDRIGRDVFSRIIVGSTVSLQVAAGAVALSVLLGAPIGALASYVGGWFDSIVQRVMDAIMAFPSLILAIAMVAITGPSLVTLWFAISLNAIPRYSRLIRSGVLTQKEREYVEAARAIGESPASALLRYIVPNIMAPIAVQITLDLARAILVEATLSFLGLGLAPPTISWGQMIQEAQNFMQTAPWTAIFPGLAIAVAIFAFVLIGDALRDQLDPRARALIRRRERTAT